MMCALTSCVCWPPHLRAWNHPGSAGSKLSIRRLLVLLLSPLKSTSRIPPLSIFPPAVRYRPASAIFEPFFLLLSFSHVTISEELPEFPERAANARQNAQSGLVGSYPSSQAWLGAFLYPLVLSHSHSLLVSSPRISAFNLATLP